VDREVNQAQVAPLAFEPLDRGPPGVRGAVVDDPEHPPRRGGGLARHHLLDQPPEGLDPGPLVDPIEQACVVDVPGGQVGERAAAAVLELGQRGAARSGGDSGWRRPSACSWDFSSAQITNSPECKSRPSKRRA
jgi:hypothetical protein